jgi:hypothetical protein
MYDIQDKFDIYLPINAVKRKLRKRKNPFTLRVNWEDYQVTLKDMGNRTLVEIESLEGSDTIDAVVEIRSQFVGDLVDNATIARVQAILDVNPDSKFFKSIMSDLKSGEELGFRAEEILEETEERMANLDPAIEAKIQQALSSARNNSFLKSIDRYFRSGGELSTKQLDALDKFISNAQVKQEASRAEFRKRKDQIDKVEKALSLQPNSPFLKEMESHLIHRHFPLSKAQERVVDEIISEASAPVSPLVAMLSDLEANGRYLTRDDYMAIRKGKKNVAQLSDEERKRLRHLIYKNVKRLSNSYGRDDVRSMLKQASTDYMRLLKPRIRPSSFDNETLFTFAELKEWFKKHCYKGVAPFALEDRNHFSRTVSKKFGLTHDEVMDSIDILSEAGVISFDSGRSSFISRLFGRRSASASDVATRYMSKK